MMAEEFFALFAAEKVTSYIWAQEKNEPESH